MLQRFKRLFSPASVLTIGLLLVGVNQGITYSLNAYRWQLQREYRVEVSEWRDFAVEVWNLQTGIASAVLAAYVMATLLAPEPDKGDRAAIRRLARKRLAEPLLPQSEQAFWVKLLEEVDNA